MLGRPADGLVVVDTHLEIDRRMCALFECLLRSDQVISAEERVVRRAPCGRPAQVLLKRGRTVAGELIERRAPCGRPIRVLVEE